MQMFSKIMSLVAKAVDVRPKTEVNRNLRVLFDFFAEVLEVRVLTADKTHYSSYSQGSLDSLEATILDATMTLVFKVNDAVFKPFVARLVERIAAPYASSSPNTDVQTLRSITLFNFFNLLSEKLKVGPLFSVSLLQKLMRTVNCHDLLRERH